MACHARTCALAVGRRRETLCLGGASKKQAEVYRYGRLDMLPCQISKSLVNTVHSVWVSCPPFHTHHDNGPNSFYSRVANSMTEKPPLDERHTRLIEFTKRETPIDCKRLRGARCKRRFWMSADRKTSFARLL